MKRTPDDERKRDPYARSTQYELSETEFQEEVALAGRRSLAWVTPPVDPYLGAPIPAGQTRAPRAFHRDMRMEETDSLRNPLCPEYGDCLNAADVALAKPKKRLYEDAVTFVCDQNCPKRDSTDTSSLGQFSKDFMSFMLSDKKAVR